MRRSSIFLSMVDAAAPNARERQRARESGEGDGEGEASEEGASGSLGHGAGARHSHRHKDKAGAHGIHGGDAVGAWSPRRQSLKQLAGVGVPGFRFKNDIFGLDSDPDA